MPTPATAARLGPTMRSLANPPLIALGLAVVFLLALFVAVMLGSDAQTASADEAGAAVVTPAEDGAAVPL